MLSRVAENLYWISRYVERAENVARLLDVGFHLELDASGLAGDVSGQAPIESVLTILDCREAFEKTHGREVKDREALLRFLTFERQNSHSIMAMLARARENARGTQETLSGEVWSHVNKLYLYVGSPRAQRRFKASPSRFFDGIKRSCILFDGLVDGTLPRTEVFHFLQIGRYLERVNQISRILNVKLHGLTEGGPVEEPMRIVHWASLLRSCSAYEAYLREHHDRVDPEGVVRYLVLDADFPRAMRFCVARCCDSLREIAGGDEDEYRSEAERQLGRLDSELRYIDVEEIFSKGLSNFLNGVQNACNRIGQEIHQAYFLN
ncbi:alpha-E domain-containing protein [Tundrisphaera lichenicola]|uniref:alpha-E domain-containing protein n=1 Tax=Tundrisphaera lichenicola TaxID=2029860 RepID=UPI003EBE77F2